MDGGTLVQLRNVINRRNVKKHPSDNMTACEDFFLLVVEVHILTAAMTVFGMRSVDDQPSSVFFPEGSSELDTLQRRNILMLAVRKVVGKVVDLSYGEEKQAATEDHIQAYASEVLALGLLLMEFNDAIREGDGPRIIRCWRYFLLLFKMTNRTNYSIEAFTLLAQYHFLLSLRMAMQLTMNRTVNIHGRPGKNVSCDLHMEHLNREAKHTITGLGSNITDKAVKRVGKSIGQTVKILKRFDEANAIKEPSSRRSKRSCQKDMQIMLKQLHETSRVFTKVAGRAHLNFPKFLANVPRTISIPELTQWMGERLQKIVTYTPRP